MRNNEVTHLAMGLHCADALTLVRLQFFGVTGFGFTKENELFVGRVAQLGFASALIGEAITGVGPLAQLGLETGIPLLDAEPVLLVGIILTLFTAINEVHPPAQ